MNNPTISEAVKKAVDEIFDKPDFEPVRNHILTRKEFHRLADAIIQSAIDAAARVEPTTAGDLADATTPTARGLRSEQTGDPYWQTWYFDEFGNIRCHDGTLICTVADAKVNTGYALGRVIEKHNQLWSTNASLSAATTEISGNETPTAQDKVTRGD